MKGRGGETGIYRNKKGRKWEGRYLDRDGRRGQIYKRRKGKDVNKQGRE